MILGFEKSFCWHSKCWNSKYFWYFWRSLGKWLVRELKWCIYWSWRRGETKEVTLVPLICCVKDGPAPLWLVETSSSNKEDEWTGFHVICWWTRGFYLSLAHPDPPLRKSSFLWAHSKQWCSVLCVCSLSYMSRPRSRHLVENSHSVTWPTIWMD